MPSTQASIKTSTINRIRASGTQTKRYVADKLNDNEYMISWMLLTGGKGSGKPRRY